MIALRESKKVSVVKEESPIAKEVKKDEIEEPVEVVAVEESKDIEMEEAVAEGSYQEDFNDSLGGGGIEQSSKLNIKKDEVHEQMVNEAKKEEVSKIDHEQEKSIISNTS